MLVERRRGQYTTEHALVITVENASNAGEGGDCEDTGILDKCHRSASIHEGFSTVQSRDGNTTGHHFDCHDQTGKFASVSLAIIPSSTPGELEQVTIEAR